MYKIRPITRYEHIWITSETLHTLFSQLTDSVLLPEKQFRQWYDEMHETPCFTLFGVMVSPEKYPKLIGVGTLWVQPKYYRNNGKSGHIEDIIIDKNHRKQGLGKRLVQHMIQYAKENGCYKVQLHCHPEKQSFYEQLAFKNNTKSMAIYFND